MPIYLGVAAGNCSVGNRNPAWVLLGIFVQPSISASLHGSRVDHGQIAEIAARPAAL